MEKTRKKQRPRWKKTLTMAIIFLAFVIAVDGFVTLRTGYLYNVVRQPLDSFIDKVFVVSKEFRQAHLESGSNKVADSVVSSMKRRKDEPVTTISLVGLDKEEIIQPLKMPNGFLPTTVYIYDTEQLIGSKGYLLEWDQWETERSGWYPRRWSLMVKTAKQNYRLWGFGIDGGVYATNVVATAASKLAEEFNRPLPAFDRLCRVRYTCTESLKGKVYWAVFESDALWQIHFYDEQGRYQRSVGWFSDRVTAKNAVLLLWEAERKHRISPSGVTEKQYR